MRTWRHKREIIIREAEAEPGDAERSWQLASLLATGLERLLAKRLEPVDFRADVEPTCDRTEQRTAP